MSDTTLAEQVLDTWRIHDRINRYLLAAVPAEAMGAVSRRAGAPWASSSRTCTTCG